MSKVKNVAKAIGAGVGAVVSYFIGVIPSEGGFDDLSTVQWLGAVPILLGVYGITWAVPDAASRLRKRSAVEPEPPSA